MLNGLFDIDNRLDYLTENGDMLPRLKDLVPWEKFRRDLEAIYDHECKSNDEMEYQGIDFTTGIFNG
jgi:hypothetical protein